MPQVLQQEGCKKRQIVAEARSTVSTGLKSDSDILKPTLLSETWLSNQSSQLRYVPIP
jgi:hypothetical protein